MGRYRRETELKEARSQAYFHFLVTDFLQDNGALGVGWKMAQNRAARSAKLSRDENSYLRGRRKTACHRSSPGMRL